MRSKVDGHSAVLNSRPEPQADVEFLSGGGEMGERMRALDWAQTPLGSPATWPQSLRIAIRLMLAARQPIWIGWGPELLYFYNDSYKPIVGARHPAALGLPAERVWPETWSEIGPMLRSALNGNVGTYVESHLLIMERNGYPEETYYTWSYTPIPNDDNGAGGIFCANTDDTRRVIGERQLTLLRELSAKSTPGRTTQQVCEQCIGALATDPRDLPFALIYLPDGGESTMKLSGACGIARGHPMVPEFIGGDARSPWPILDLLAAQELQVVALLPSRSDIPLPTGARHRPPTQAAALPIKLPGYNRCGALIVGLNPFRRFDENYRSFLTLIADQIAAALGNAETHEQERRRADALTEIDRAKTIFFSNISHEFRTPLTLMLGPVAEVAVDPTTPASSRTRLALAHRNALRLLKLINNLLDYSRLEAGRVQASYEPTDLAGLTRDLASTFRSAMERANLLFEVDCPPLPEPVYVDREMWEKIVLNLLSNAFKYTLQGAIHVRLSRRGAQVVLEVSDTGVGIPSRELPRLFERFHRVEGTVGRTQEGSGIGLALVQELVKLHGGSIAATSESGVGTSFEVKIPLGSAHLPKERIQATHPLGSPAASARAFVEEALRWIPESAESSSSRLGRLIEMPTDTRLARTAGARIVLADDNRDMCEYVESLLCPPYLIEAVSDGEAALEAIRREPPDLVLSDVMMPRLDGLALLKALRADEALQRIPVILLSARAGEEARLEGLGEGADDYLVKPFSARELTARVSSLLELAKMRREHEERFRTFVSATSDVIFRMSPDWEVMLQLIGRGFIPDTLEPTRHWLDKYIPPGDQPRMLTAIKEAMSSGKTFRFEHRVRCTDGSFGWAISRAIPLEDPQGAILEWFGAQVDVTERRRTEDLLAEQTRLLELIASQRPLRDCLEALAACVCRLQPLARGSVLLADESRSRIERCFSSDVPASFGQGIEHAPINDLAIGTCGTAIFRGESIGCQDIARDEHWSQPWRDLCVAHGIRAAHSTPIFGVDDVALGSFFLCFAEARAPDPWDLRIAAFGAHVAAIAVERERVKQKLLAGKAQQALLLEISDALRTLVDPVEIQGTAARIVGEHLHVERAAYGEMQPDDTTLVVERDWHLADAATIVGRFSVDEFAPCFASSLRAGQAATVEDTLSDPRVSPEERAKTWDLIDVRSAIACPIMKEGRLTAAFFIHHRKPRRWSDEEMSLVGEAADRTRAAVHRARAETALRTSEEKLREVDRRKDEFLAMLAHELRNPLAPIGFAGELLSRIITKDSRAHLAIEMIKRQVTQLTRMVDDLLDVSRITQGRIELKKEPVDLASVIAQAVETIEPAMRREHHDLSIRSSSERFYVNGDFVRLVQSVANILANAVKYTDAHGQIRIELRAEASSAVIEITDTGRGIPGDLLPKVFDLFVQNDRTLDRAQGGLGIGLAVVKRLIEQHQGEVRAKSAGPGLGSTFEIRLPRIPPPQNVKKESPAFALPARRVLIVDDNHDAADSLEALLRLQGHQTRVAHSGKAALELIQEFTPEAALLDIGLPEMNGYELAGHLRAAPQLRGIRLIALTGYGHDDDRRRARDAGFDAHLVKPVDFAALERMLAAPWD